ncbi:adenylate isopentenyltransferase 5 chloroplastic [Phtheirospermum japonicum]|uniref:Adenylate isopentenyltransferase 5 chloroplastic n=1 Tax=Phtheirospermum japonicum TaxID=374723 RepID=A0A830BIP7_9LAMI|nr:adenylate isopentenyltransferase 5 chloroplastic [Phtheirospermum japonicum]
MGATGTGKSRLSIDLASQFNGEIINSDKIQVYKGLNIVTNKVTEEESCGVPHHLLGIIEPDADFSAQEFVHHATIATEAITHRARLPIIAGGSNSFIKALVNDDTEFRSKFECCFLWVDVSIPVLHSAVTKRVDQMVRGGLVGIRRAIGVPEMDELFRNEDFVDDETRAKLLEGGIEKIKANTRNLASRQLKNILKLEEQLQCQVHRLNATEMFLKHGREADEAWEKLVADPSTKIVGQFLCEDNNSIDFVPAPLHPIAANGTNLGPAAAAIATTTHY